MCKTIKIFTASLIVGTAFVSPALALTPDQIAQQQIIIQQQQEQARQNEQNRRMATEAQRIRTAQEAAAAAEKAAATGAAGENAECPKFATIKVLGNTVYSDKKLKKITDKYLGQCITKDNMSALQNDLTAIYIDHKYTLARIYFDQRHSKLTKGDCDMVFIVEEGVVNKVWLQDQYDGQDYEEPTGWWQKFRNSTKKFMAIPFAEGDVFYIKDFEQALDQLNRLQSNSATMDIRPTPGLDAAGHSDIYILNKHKSGRTTFFGAGIDNSGNDSTGAVNWNVNLNQDNLLALDDNIYVKYSRDADFQTDHHYNQSIFSALSIPFGYWTANASVSWADYLTTVNGLYTSFHTSGDTLTQTYSLDRVVYRSARYRTNLGAAFQLRDTENWIRDMKSVTGSRRASNINVFWNNLIFHPYGTLVIKPSYQRGLNLFGSRVDPSDVMAMEPHLQYDMLKLYVYSTMKFDVGIPLTWNLTFDGQYAFQNLYGVDQQSLGGEWTIRGFRNSTISGDQGFYVRNDFRVPLDRLMPDFITGKEFMNKDVFWGEGAGSTNSALARTQIGIFGDYGYVRNAVRITPDPYNSNSGSMAGIGGGLFYTGKYLSWSLVYAHALSAPSFLQTRDGIKKEEQSIYWRITATY